MRNLTFNQRRGIISVILGLAGVARLSVVFEWKVFGSHDEDVQIAFLVLLALGLRLFFSMEELRSRRRRKPRTPFVDFIANLSIILLTSVAVYATEIKEWVGAGRWERLSVTGALILAGALLLTLYGRVYSDHTD